MREVLNYVAFLILFEVSIPFLACHNWKPTPEASIRRRLDQRLVNCIAGSVTPWQRLQCMDESYADCEDAGLEPGCSVDHFEPGLRSE